MDTWLQESEFVEGFTKSSLMILVSEIGDKTFFIAAVMAMRHPQLTARAAAPQTKHIALLRAYAPLCRCLWARWARCGS